HKPIVFVCEDDLQANPINLMLAKGITQCLTSVDELATSTTHRWSAGGTNSSYGGWLAIH
ncbi:hypothetical protein ACQ5RM_04050, partial [Latilactobacillus curvatus]